MKKIQMVIPIVLILMLASFTTPGLATKGKNEKIDSHYLAILEIKTQRSGDIFH